VLNVAHPVKNGIQDVDAMEKIYMNIFDKLKIQVNEHQMLICDPPLNTVENKYSIAELLLEKFEAQCKNKSTKVFSKEKHFFF
jgi:actin-related protein